MTGRFPRALAAATAFGLVMAACTESPTPSPTPTPHQEAGLPTLPAGCSSIDLRDPNGERVDLSGEWTGSSWFSGASAGERTFILQLGNCVWVTITDARFHAAPVTGEAILGVLYGHLAPDFSLTGDLVTILRDAPVGGFSDQQTFAATRLLVEFDADGRIGLREDREPGVTGPRCTQPPSACPEPVVLHPVAEIPVPSPP